jgi:hypothetical protein
LKNTYTNDNPNAGFAQGKWTERFSEYLQGLPNRKEIAACLGVPYSTFDNWVRGIQSFPPDLLSKLYACTGAKELWPFFLDPCGLMAIAKAKPRHHIPATNSPDIFRHLMDATESLTKAHAAYKVALKDGNIDEHEAARITYFLNEAQREEAAIEEDVRAEVGK